MTEDEMKRNFKMSKADLCMFASILANTLTRDIADLTPFGVTTAKIAELKTLGDDYEVFPSDDYLVGTMMIATDEKNAKIEEVKEAIRQLAASDIPAKKYVELNSKTTKNTLKICPQS